MWRTPICPTVCDTRKPTFVRLPQGSHFEQLLTQTLVYSASITPSRRFSETKYPQSAGAYPC